MKVRKHQSGRGSTPLEPVYKHASILFIKSWLYNWRSPYKQLPNALIAEQPESQRSFRLDQRFLKSLLWVATINGNRIVFTFYFYSIQPLVIKS